MAVNDVSESVIDLIHSHRSIRRYKPDPIPNETVETIVGAGQRASTSSNFQTYSVVAVTEQATRDKLAELCAEQDHIRQAPVFLAWCADRFRLERLCQLRGYKHVGAYVENFLVAAVDAALAMQNAALAAESMGLGMCYIGSIRNHSDEIIRLLELPEFVFPISGMTVGFPDASPQIRPRLPLDAVLHWESYKQEGLEAALKEYDKAMIVTGIYRGRQVAVPGKEGKMEDYGWTEHTARRVSRPVRTELRQILAEQGFEMR